MAYKFRVGDPNGQYLSWDGNNLRVIGSVTIQGGSGWASLTDAPASLAEISPTESALLASVDSTIVGWKYPNTTFINGGQIYTGSITANKLVIAPGGAGAALNTDANLTDPTAWTTGALFVTVTDGKVGLTAVRSNSGTYNSILSTAALRIPVDPLKTYRFHVWVRRSDAVIANGTFYGGVALYDAAGATIAGSGSYWYYYPSGTQTTPGVWTEFSFQFGAGTAQTFPTNARTMSPLALLNYAGTLGYYEIQDLRIEEVMPSTLIKDGAITTAKISVASLAAVSAVTGALTVNDSLTVGTSGVVKSGATGFSTGVGYWLAYNAGVPQFRIGNPAANYMQWDGTNLTFSQNGGFWDQFGIRLPIGQNTRDLTHAFGFSGGAAYLGMFATTIWSTSGSLELLNVATTNFQNENLTVRIEATTHDASAYLLLQALENAGPSLNLGRVYVYSNTGEYFFNPPAEGSATADACWVTATPWQRLAHTSSDERLKTAIQPLDLGMTALRSIVPIRFQWQADGRDDIGFSAQNCLASVPEAAPLLTNGLYGFRAAPLLAVAVNAIRELDARLTRLEKQHADDQSDVK